MTQNSCIRLTHQIMRLVFEFQMDRKKGNYTVDEINKAVDLVIKNGYSVRKAANVNEFCS